MADNRRITGEEILERWQAYPFELVQAMLSGELVALDPKDGFRFTEEIDKCFFCVHEKLSGDGSDVCTFENNKRPESRYFCKNDTDEGLHIMFCGDCSPNFLSESNEIKNEMPEKLSPEWVEYVSLALGMTEKKLMTTEKRATYRIEKAMKAAFYLSEVEAYEQAHGLGPLPHKPETAEALAETLRAAGITDAEMIARMIMASFPMTERKLGALMRGEADDDSHEAGNVKAARRLLGKSK